jgi:enoyl-CoA hydratase
MPEVILYEVIDRVAWITLNRPEAMNAINEALRSGLSLALDQAATDDDVRCVVLIGAGERAFCAGADLKEGKFQDSPIAFRSQRKRGRWISSFDRNPKPTIAAIRGFCLGGGLEIALACDMRVGSSDALLGLPETQYGIIPAAGGTQRIAQVVGLGIALEMVLTGRRLKADEALQWGLLNRVVPGADVRNAAQEMAKAIVERPPTATQFAKEAVRFSVSQNLGNTLEREVDLAALLMAADERTSGLEAFRRKNSVKKE